MFVFVVLGLVFSTKPTDWLGRTSPVAIECVTFSIIILWLLG